MTESPEGYESSLRERIDKLYFKFKPFKVTAETIFTFETFYDIFSKVIDKKIIDKGIMLRIFNDIPKNGKQTFNLEEFLSSYKKNLRRLNDQKEVAQKLIEKLESQKQEVEIAINSMKLEEMNNIGEEKENNKLYITVYEAKELNMNEDEQICVRINCGTVTVNTNLIFYSSFKSAIWGEKFVFPIRTGQEKINVMLISKSSSSISKILGNIQISVSTFKDQILHEEWFNLSYDEEIISNKVKLGIQWIYSKLLYLETTYGKIKSHLKLQEEDVEEFTKEIQKFNDMLPDQDLNAFNFNTLPDNEISPKESPIHFLSTLKPDHLHFEEGLKTLQDQVHLTEFNKKEFSAHVQTRSTKQIQRKIEILEKKSIEHDTQRPNSPYKMFNLTQEHENKKIGVSFNESQNTNAEVEKTRKEILKLKRQLEEVQIENGELRKNLEEIQNKRNKEKETLLNHFQKENETNLFQLVGEVDRLSKIISEKNKEIEKWKTQYYTIVNQESEINRDLQIQIQELREDNSQLNHNMDTKREEIKKLEEQYNQVQGNTFKMLKEISENKLEMEKIKKENLKKANENDELKLKIAQYEDIVKSLPIQVNKNNYVGISEILQNSINNEYNLTNASLKKNYFSPFANN